MADILVVDDDPGMVGLLTLALSRMGHRVISASNGVEALEILSEDGVHLVVTDIDMPKMNGFDLITSLLERFPEKKILAISGGGNDGPEENLRIALELGAVCCLSKPFSIADFQAHVEALLNAGKAVVRCKLIDMCGFYTANHGGSKVAEMQKKVYCLGNSQRCARYAIARTLGCEFVPPSLYPCEMHRVNNILQMRRR